ncbi:MAG: hypothetical protein ACLUW6_07545 [Coriobacteriaceae bacterium]
MPTISGSIRADFLFLAAAMVAVTVIYVASAFVAAKLYEKREF